MHALLSDVHEKVSADEVKRWMDKLDPDKSGDIDTSEFVDAMLEYVTRKANEEVEVEVAGAVSYEPPPPPRKDEAAEQAGEEGAAMAAASAAGEDEQEEEGEDDEDEDEEDAEVPEDLQELDWQEQQWHIKMRAAKMMGVGTGLILLFSDPMVDVLSNIGDRLEIPPFYIAFVLAPLASNASEFIASYNYAAKKTQKTITVSLAALEGAACMNNTFCLAIFMGLVFFKQLAWKFSAETLAVLIIEVLVGIIALRQTMELWVAIVILTLFPISIIFIAGLEAIGLD
eukprot:Transcript_32537.p2 GENE.Transcript_32537~~Transcript_32537.p2  ORF type:complete len:285 (-),score=136.29 Transcript_32537:303-1157(-)